MSYLRYALILLVVLLGLAFHVRNGQVVVVDFYLGSYAMPLSVALAAALLVGALLGVLAGLPTWLGLRRDKARLGRRLKARESDQEAAADRANQDT